ncbi:hypothetical protein ABK040_009673 [Willaertia magna]
MASSSSLFNAGGSGNNIIVIDKDITLNNTNYIIPLNTTLIINPGITITLHSTIITIYGNIQAIGQELNPILFTGTFYSIHINNNNHHIMNTLQQQQSLIEKNKFHNVKFLNNNNPSMINNQLLDDSSIDSIITIDSNINDQYLELNNVEMIGFSDRKGITKLGNNIFNLTLIINNCKFINMKSALQINIKDEISKNIITINNSTFLDLTYIAIEIIGMIKYGNYYRDAINEYSKLNIYSSNFSNFNFKNNYGIKTNIYLNSINNNFNNFYTAIHGYLFLNIKNNLFKNGNFGILKSIFYNVFTYQDIITKSSNLVIDNSIFENLEMAISSDKTVDYTIISNNIFRNCKSLERDDKYLSIISSLNRTSILNNNFYNCKFKKSILQLTDIAIHLNLEFSLNKFYNNENINYILHIKGKKNYKINKNIFNNLNSKMEIYFEDCNKINLKENYWNILDNKIINRIKCGINMECKDIVEILPIFVNENITDNNNLSYKYIHSINSLFNSNNNPIDNSNSNNGNSQLKSSSFNKESKKEGFLMKYGIWIIVGGVSLLLVIVVVIAVKVVIIVKYCCNNNNYRNINRQDLKEYSSVN